MNQAQAPLNSAASHMEGRSSAVDSPVDTMRAIAYDRYGSFEVLGPRLMERPLAKDNEVLVRVHAAALHIGDCFGVRGTPYLMRLVFGLRKPKYGVPGFDLAGVVEKAGKDVRRFRVGDEVFGAGNGSCAEYVSFLADCRRALTPTGTLVLKAVRAQKESQ